MLGLLHPHPKDAEALAARRLQAPLSVFIEMELGEKFDAEAVVDKMMSGRPKPKYHGMSRGQILNQWSYAARHHTNRDASLRHYISATLQDQPWEGKPVDEAPAVADWLAATQRAGIDIYRCGWLIRGSDGNIGQPDFVGVHRNTPDDVLEVHLAVLQRGKDVSRRNNFRKTLSEPFVHLPDTVFHRAALRLSAEQQILEEYQNVKYREKVYPRVSVITRELVVFDAVTTPGTAIFHATSVLEERRDAKFLLAHLKEKRNELK